MIIFSMLITTIDSNRCMNKFSMGMSWKVQSTRFEKVVSECILEKRVSFALCRFLVAPRVPWENPEICLYKVRLKTPFTNLTESAPKLFNDLR